jgi:filamentous hemagglutinin family protein
VTGNRKTRPPLGRVTRNFLAGLGAGAGLALAPLSAHAQLVNPNVTQGRASIGQSATATGTHTRIDTQKSRTTIRWDRFDIPGGDSVHIEQPNRRSTTRNLVSDASVTRIDGSLTSNGQVWIVNPAGIYFGGQALVEVAGLVAAAGSVSRQALLNDRQHFTDVRGTVVNEGRIVADSIALVGRSVANHGQIVARRGDLVMAAGDDVWVTRQDTHISVMAPDLATGASAADPSLENTGTLVAQRGRARLAAGDFLGLAIRNTGAIRAHEISLKAGAESVVEVRGEFDAANDAPGKAGGRIEIEGDWIVVDDATLDASGSAGGGTLLVGGEAGGRDVVGGVRSARGVLVGDGASLRADALAKGDGGEIVLWSDELTQVAGTLSARGGAHGGDGGFIETSSAGRLDLAADVDVSAPVGASGAWLLDPVNVAIVAPEVVEDALDAAGEDDVIELFEFDFGNAVRFQPLAPPPDVANPTPPPAQVPGTSLVSSQSLVTALQRGGSVTVTTEALTDNTSTEAEGWIEVRDAIMIPLNAQVRPNTVSTLTLLAADDVRVKKSIESLSPDLRLSINLIANDNPVSTGGQPENQTTIDGVDRRRLGDVILEPDLPGDPISIRTQGGNVTIEGTNVVLSQDVTIDTALPDPEVSGGIVDLFADDLVASGLLIGSADTAGLYGNTRVNGSIVTNGGTFTSSGEVFELGDAAVIDVFRENADGDRFGGVSIRHTADVAIDGDITAEAVDVFAGTSGTGDLSIGGLGLATIIARDVQLSAGDGVPSQGNETEAQITIGADASFRRGTSTTDFVLAPESFEFNQDAAITDAHVPAFARFGDGSQAAIADMFYVLSTRDGSGVLGVPDITLSDGSKVVGTDLVLTAPASVSLEAPIAPHHVEISIQAGFTVTPELAANLVFTGPGAFADDGVLRIHAGVNRDLEGNLDFASGVTLSAPRIALRAGDGGGATGIGSGFESVVNARGPEGGIAPEFQTDSFEIRQDADLTDANVPDLARVVQLTPAEPLAYALLSEGGDITLTDATRVANTDLTLTAFGTIELENPITVHSADLGGFASFQVTEDLLDAVRIDAGGGPRILTLRAGNGTLAFQSTKNIAPEGQPAQTVDVQLRVEAERIELVGQTINVATGRPLFQVDEVTSTERLVFTHGGLVSDSSLPTAANYPDGLGPSELLVVQSLLEISLRQQGLGETWQFPAPGALILSAASVTVDRTDGYDLVLGPQDQIWTNVLQLRAFAEPPALPAIGGAAVDAATVGSIRGFDATIDFLSPDDVASIARPMDADGVEIGVGRFEVVQEADFALRTGTNLLPNFDGLTALAFQPEAYSLISLEGSIEVDNALLGGTRLELRVDASQGVIDFDGANPLDVVSLLALGGDQLGISQTFGGGDFFFGADTLDLDGSGDPIGDGANVIAEESILIGSGGAQPGSLGFASNVRLEAPNIELLGGLSGGTDVVDARTREPEFVGVENFRIAQGAAIRNGLADLPPDEIDWGQLPAVAQFEGLTPLERYVLETRAGEIELNEVSEVLHARSVQIFAGTTTAPQRLTLRADRAPTVPCASVCGTDSLAGDLVLLDGVSPVQAVELRGNQIFLEAVNGYVDAGDPRITFNLLGADPVLAIRQSDAIAIAIDPMDPTLYATRLPAGSQLVQGITSATYLVQSVGGIELGAALAERLTGTNLVLVAGVLEAEIDASLRSRRLGEPIFDEDVDPDLPDPVYDRFADRNDDGQVDDVDESLLDGLDPARVRIADSVAFDLLLRSLAIESTPGDGADIELGSVSIRTEANQFYRDEIELVGDVMDDGEDEMPGTSDDFVVPTELTARAGLLTALNPITTPPGSTIVFEHTIDGNTVGGESLVVNATERIQFLGELGTNVRLGGLTLNLEQLIQFEAEPPVPIVEFGSADTGGTFRVVASSILLNPESGDRDSRYVRERVPDTATFFRIGGSLELDAGPGGTVQMGRSEKLSANGPELTIRAQGGDLTLGDLSALEKITVDAGIDGDIHLVRRGGGPLLRANGRRIKDPGVDFVANEIDFIFAFDAASDPTGSGTLLRNQVGSGRSARFGVADPENAPGFMETFSVLGLRYNILDGTGLGFGGSDIVIDGVPDGISRLQIADSYADLRPDVPIAVPAVLRVRQPDALAAVGIELREPSRSELHSRLRGAGTYFDLASMRNAAQGELDVSEVRLVAGEIQATADLYARAFGQDGSRAPRVREVLQAVVDDYRQSTGARRIVGFELRRYVYNRPSSQFQAYQELQTLDSLFRHHRRSGLTPTEYGAIQQEWLEAIVPEGITVRELAEFIHPSRYVRGSDVLDVFGD